MVRHGLSQPIPSNHLKDQNSCDDCQPFDAEKAIEEEERKLIHLKRWYFRKYGDIDGGDIQILTGTSEATSKNPANRKVAGVRSARTRRTSRNTCGNETTPTCRRPGKS
ncbi:UNVERIFIED_CONTAM: hypothetical protein PYX00_004267 [Menopon gallinae]|uniref:Uncharacterized protein n=1 Tax=Menopon gallinae TaxID=328185 RepID=A0AAW2I4A8_9NEOP